MSDADFQRIEIMNVKIVKKIRDQIAEDIKNAAKAGPAINNNDDYWVAGMLYAANIAKGE